jgi:hypothetical protein
MTSPISSCATAGTLAAQAAAIALAIATPEGSLLRIEVRAVSVILSMDPSLLSVDTPPSRWHYMTAKPLSG